MSNSDKWKEFCSQQDSCEACKYYGYDCEIEFWKDWARTDGIRKFAEWCKSKGYSCYDWRMLIEQYEKEQKKGESK